jgi:ferric-dicitrate binding protein FerR (iron transport regulator)
MGGDWSPGRSLRMQSRGARAAIAALGIAAAIVLFIVLSGGDDEDSAATTGEATVPTIEIKDGEPAGGVQDLSFDSGEEIRFRVESDAAWEIHLHGYDIPMDVEAHGSVEFDVPATIEGVFEVEIEETATQIAEVTVNPQ